MGRSAILRLVAALLLAACGDPRPRPAAAADPATPPPGAALRIAVAANFAGTLRDLTALYQAQTGQPMTLSVGSTGSLFAQIERGAPFDLFFAADARRPTLLEESGRAIPGSRRTYARGALVLWSADPAMVSGLDVLRGDRFRKLAIANPETAPYGLAARQVLHSLGLWDVLEARIVRGQSLGQTHQFIESGAAELGFVALAQLARPGREPGGSRHLVDPTRYDPIDQQVVMLTDSAPVRGLWTWITEDQTPRERIRAYGYRTPDPPSPDPP